MLTNRWAVLALLFLVRCTMGIQFQSVPALAPAFIDNFALSLADLGTLIGLYYAPASRSHSPVVPSAAATAKRTLSSLASPSWQSGLIMASATTFPGQISGRVIAGVGGILMNVLMSKMVTDWFAGREIATAMGIFVNSWPVGIAIGLVLLPPIARAEGLAVTLMCVSAVIAVAVPAVATMYAPPPSVAPVSTPASASLSGWPQGAALVGILIAGLIWGCYNAALAMIFGFGPQMLSERGMSMIEASATTSIVMWLVALSVPLGGYLADRTGHPQRVMVLGFIGFAMALFVAARATSPYQPFVALGLISGLSAGAIMSLPSRILLPATRAIGMGLFFTVFYALQLLAPIIGGRIAKASGSAAAAFDFGAALLVICGAALAAFQIVARRQAAALAAIR